jgi:quinol monooxygenase YgiN
VGRCSYESPVVGNAAFWFAESGPRMTFIQSIEFATEQRDAVLELMKRWTADAVGNGTALRETVAEDRSAPGRFVVAVSFESAATAAQNSDRPETGAFAAEFAAMCSDGPVFREFDMVYTDGG